MPNEPVASLSDATRTYGGVPVLDGVSLDIEPGVTAVVGPNGSGKSTLLGLLAGAVAPTTGTVTRAEVTGSKPVGYLPQRVPFRDGFTARETLAFYARLVDDDPDAALERVGLGDAADRRVEALSGGMRRLLGIAQAILGEPSLVVLDEPASGLDPGMRERAFSAAACRADGDTAVVVSSHALDLVDVHADRVVILRRGRVATAGSLARLLDEHDAVDASELYRIVAGASGANSDDPDPGAAESDADARGDAEPDVHVTGVSDR
ncbi:ABC transporter ATP-binding protein [Halorubrum sp. HHNYT27]|uniref:ABC transporter ATP-binding protein n=1 Tax=Halorubrum sp. HHNYT27 TaxID=3402275 RepID=UPI003EBD9ED6